MAGHDRFVADLRPLVERRRRGRRRALLSSVRPLHGADRARARCDRDRRPTGGPLDAPLDVDADVVVGRATRTRRSDTRRAGSCGRPRATGSAARDVAGGSGFTASRVAQAAPPRSLDPSAGAASRRRRPRAGPARRHGRHRRLLGRARPAVADSRGDARRRPATRRSCLAHHLCRTRRASAVRRADRRPRATPQPPYDDVRASFAAPCRRHWAAYVAGVFACSQREQRLTLDGGARCARRV